MINVAVIGLGNMGKHHVRHWHNMPGATLRAVCDSHLDRATEYSEKYSCNAYTTLDELLTHEQLDAVSLTVPTFLHFDFAKKLLEKGLSVLIEKPISETIEQAQELIALADKKNCTLMIGHIERFNPAVSVLKQFVDEGNLGDIVSVISRRGNTFPSQMKDANVAIDLAVHDLDIVTYFLNEPPKTITSHYGNALINSRPDHLEVFMTFSKASGFVQVNWITPYPIRKLQISGTKGYADLDYKDKTVTIYPSQFEKRVSDQGVDYIQFLECKPYSLDVPSQDALFEELSHFLFCIKTKTPPLISGQAGLIALDLALNALK